MRDLVQAFFNILNIPFTFMGITFNLLDVFVAGLICSLFGLFLGKIIFFAMNRR